MTEETLDIQNLAVLERELIQINTEMFLDYKSYPTFFSYSGAKPDEQWPRNELVETRNGWNYWKKLSKKQTDAIPELLKMMNMTQIAKEYGVTPEAIGYWVRKQRSLTK